MSLVIIIILVYLLSVILVMPVWYRQSLFVTAIEEESPLAEYGRRDDFALQPIRRGKVV
jgi:hypothetical protein